MDSDIKFGLLNNSQTSFDDIQPLLERCQLRVDKQIDVFIIAYTEGDEIVACTGIYRNIIKCVAISPEFRGKNLTTLLINEATLYASDRGYFHLFLYTKPDNIHLFKRCGFYPLVTVPNLVTLMENTPVGIKSYCKELAHSIKTGDKIGSIVMNANPFTLGHRHLVEIAAKQCDWLHLFVVHEDASIFSFQDRLHLVQQGVAGITNITVHPGSEYIISKATFPSYFLKEQQEIEQAFTAIDLLIFRDYIAPTLNINYRFIGSEPFCSITKQYNEDMRYWLMQYPADSPEINVIETARNCSNDLAISATTVRALLKEGNFTKIKELVPETTLSFLKNKFTEGHS